MRQKEGKKLSSIKNYVNEVNQGLKECTKLILYNRWISPKEFATGSSDFFQVN